MSEGKRFFRKNSDYKALRRQLCRTFGKEKTARIFQQAAENLDMLHAQFPDIPKGERSHTDGYIFPRAALYRALCSESGESEAINIIEGFVGEQGKKMGAMLRKLTALPFMDRIFLRIFTSMAKNMFGENNGFRQTFHPSPKGQVRFDITECTYCRWCRRCGCPELIHSFCISDTACFGSLTGVSFERLQTLENGELCDFCLTLDKSR